MKMFCVLSLFLSLSAFAGEKHHEPAKVSPEFEKLKGLVGTWEGVTKMDGKEEKSVVTYELTSGGTALIEKLSPGTPHEMLTVYSSRGKKVSATHFCMIGNQPEMKLKKVEGSTFQFEMSGTKGISNKKEMHMHAVNLDFNADKLKQEWTNYKDNKKAETVVLEFTKKK